MTSSRTIDTSFEETNYINNRSYDEWRCMMRTEHEMMECILNVANEDDKILAVYMNGSRTNANVPKDIFQDYDIVYVVEDTRPYYEDVDWINCFGTRLYMQMPEKMDFLRGREYDFSAVYGWLIQFADGNRLDLHIVSVDYALRTIKEDKLCKVLLDKKNLLPLIPEATDLDYRIKPPTENDFLCDCNNFWWCQNNVAKGLWREEIPYVMDMINEHIRPHLVNLLAWKIGFETDFSCSIGKSAKYMKEYLTLDHWQRFLKTYPEGNVDKIWESTFVMCDLFEEIAKEVAEKANYIYNCKEAEASRKYLYHVSRLPKDATEVYLK